jgi:hypothetical protein
MSKNPHCKVRGFTTTIVVIQANDAVAAVSCQAVREIPRRLEAAVANTTLNPVTAMPLNTEITPAVAIRK